MYESLEPFRTKDLDFVGFDAREVLTLRVGAPRPVGNPPDHLTQRFLVSVNK